MNNKIQQLEKDIEKKMELHSISIDNIKRLRESLEMQTVNLEYIVIELCLLRAELAELKGGNK